MPWGCGPSPGALTASSRAVSSLLGTVLISGSPEQTGRMLDLLVAGVART